MIRIALGPDTWTAGMAAPPTMLPHGSRRCCEASDRHVVVAQSHAAPRVATQKSSTTIWRSLNALSKLVERVASDLYSRRHERGVVIQAD